jgi:predicted XRE-type DNA-binding protein
MNQRADLNQIKLELAEKVVSLLDETSSKEEGAERQLAMAPAEVEQLRAANVSDISIDRLISLLSHLDQQVIISVVPVPKGNDRRPIWEKVAEISASVPAEEWAKLPTDLAANHDHYLYGAPKRY